jgi:shikimate 5-dehydrogenase
MVCCAVTILAYMAHSLLRARGAFSGFLAGVSALSKVLVIGAGGVGSVAVHKMAMNAAIFPEIHLASRTRAKCDAIAQSVKERTGVDVPPMPSTRKTCPR